MSMYGATNFDGGGFSKGVNFKGLFVTLILCIPIGLIIGYLMQLLNI
jgi:hypothetical protein